MDDQKQKKKKDTRNQKLSSGITLPEPLYVRTIFVDYLYSIGTTIDGKGTNYYFIILHT